jgi:hypothetical protein
MMKQRRLPQPGKYYSVIMTGTNTPMYPIRPTRVIPARPGRPQIQIQAVKVRFSKEDMLRRRLILMMRIKQAEAIERERKEAQLARMRGE